MIHNSHTQTTSVIRIVPQRPEILLLTSTMVLKKQDHYSTQ